jgi:hypothetical protein
MGKMHVFSRVGLGVGVGFNWDSCIGNKKVMEDHS